MNSKKSPSSFSPLAAAVFTLFPLLCGFLSSRASGDIPSVYASLHQPPLSPPGAVFPVVWTLLYLLMGFGFYLVIREGIKKGADLRPASASYLFQLLLNLLWPIVFFRLGLRFGNGSGCSSGSGRAPDDPGIWKHQPKSCPPSASLSSLVSVRLLFKRRHCSLKSGLDLRFC